MARAVPDPTHDEIAARCAEIREQWTEHTRMQRWVRVDQPLPSRYADNGQGNVVR